MIFEPKPPPVPVISLEDRMKTWPILAAHRMEEIEKVLLAFEAKLNVFEPKVGVQKSIFGPSANAGLDDPYHGQPKPVPFVPIPPAGPLPAQPTPIPEPSTLPTPSYAHTEQFAGKSIFAPPASPPVQTSGGSYGLGSPGNPGVFAPPTGKPV